MDLAPEAPWGLQGIEPSSAGERERLKRAGAHTIRIGGTSKVVGGGRLGRPDDPHSGGAWRGVKSFVSWDSGPGVAARAFDTKQVKARRYV